MRKGIAPRMSGLVSATIRPLIGYFRQTAERPCWGRGRYDAPVRGFTGDPWTRRRDRGSVES